MNLLILRKLRLFLLAFGLGLVVVPIARAQVTIYAKFGNATGSYMGEVTTPAAYAGWAQLQSFNAGFDATAPALGGGGSGAGKATAESVVTVRPTDRLSPFLFHQLVGGVNVGGGVDPGLTVDFVKAGSTTPYLRLEYKAPFATNQSGAGNTGDSVTSEQYIMAYTSVRMTYNPPAGGTAIVYAWNFATNSSTY